MCTVFPRLSSLSCIQAELRVAKELVEVNRKRADAAEWSMAHLEIRLVQTLGGEGGG